MLFTFLFYQLQKKKKKSFKNEKKSKGNNRLFKQVLKWDVLFTIFLIFSLSPKAVRMKREMAFKEKLNNVFFKLDWILF